MEIMLKLCGKMREKHIRTTPLIQEKSRTNVGNPYPHHTPIPQQRPIRAKALGPGPGCIIQQNRMIMQEYYIGLWEVVLHIGGGGGVGKVQIQIQRVTLRGYRVVVVGIISMIIAILGYRVWGWCANLHLLGEHSQQEGLKKSKSLGQYVLIICFILVFECMHIACFSKFCMMLSERGLCPKTLAAPL